MAEPDSEHPDGDPRVADAVLEFLRAQDHRTPLDLEAWVVRYPEEIRLELREIAAGLDLLCHRPSPAVMPFRNRSVADHFPDFGK